MANITIIIPVYNVEKYVKRSIESAMNQTQKDIDIILVDDGSTDSSGKICDDYAKTDSRISVIHKANGGLSDARNVGIQKAVTQYVLLLDGDDYLREDTTEILEKTVEKYSCDVLQFGYQEVINGKINNSEVLFDGEISQAKTANQMYYNLYRFGGVCASCTTKLFKRELLLKIPFINVQHEDEMWCTQAFSDGICITYLPQNLYYYVMREGSIMHSKFNKRKMDIFKINKLRLEALGKLNISEFNSLEYEKLFLSVLRLYCEAKAAGDIEAMEVIKKVFGDNKTQMKKYKSLFSKKFMIIFDLMYVSFSCINLYYLYWKKINV